MGTRALALAPTAGSSLQPPDRAICGSTTTCIASKFTKAETWHRPGDVQVEPRQWIGGVAAQGIVGNILQVGPVPLDEERLCGWLLGVFDRR